MRILFDHCTPRPLRNYLPSHVIDTADRMGWDRLSNGELLAEAERAGHYDVFVTTDGDMIKEQDLTGWGFAVVVILAGQWPLIEPVARSGRIRSAVENTPKPGSTDGLWEGMGVNTLKCPSDLAK